MTLTHSWLVERYFGGRTGELEAPLEVLKVVEGWEVVQVRGSSPLSLNQLPYMPEVPLRWVNPGLGASTTRLPLPAECICTDGIGWWGLGGMCETYDPRFGLIWPCRCRVREVPQSTTVVSEDGRNWCRRCGSLIAFRGRRGKAPLAVNPDGGPHSCNAQPRLNGGGP